MVWEGMVEEGLAICRAVHDRYHPAKRNPYNEVECSDHYARALASWGVYTALAGFDFHGPAGRLSFDPRITPESFKAAYTVAEGWGVFEQSLSDEGQKSTISMKRGRLVLRDLAIRPVPGTSPTSIQVTLPGEEEVSVDYDDGLVHLKFEKPLTIESGQSITVTLA
jgi:hypothetical protein